MKEVKLKKKVYEFKRQQPYVVHPAQILFEHDGSIYWTFVFHPDIIYRQSADDLWINFQGEINELLKCLDQNDKEQKQIHQQIQYQFEQGIIENAKPEILKDISYYTDLIFDYETYLNPKKKRSHGRREVKTPIEKKFDDITEMIKMKYIPDRISDQSLKDLVHFMVDEI